MDNPEPPAPVRSLREALQASGARPNSRLSEVSRYMLDHYDEVHALKVVARYSWHDIVAVMVKQPDFQNASGRERLTVTAAKLAWSRTNKRRRQDATTRAGIVQQPPTVPRFEPDLPAITPANPTVSDEFQPQGTSSQSREDIVPGSIIEPFSIRPAVPRSTPFAPDATKDHVKSVAPPLAEEEVERRLAELAARQAGPRIRPPELL